jgi:hypothetical protein
MLGIELNPLNQAHNSECSIFFSVEAYPFSASPALAAIASSSSTCRGSTFRRLRDFAVNPSYAPS